MEEFLITRVYADAQGESHFAEISVPLRDGGPIGFLSEPQAVQTIIFRKVKPDYDYQFHTAPARQYIVLLDGEIEIETSLGEKRRFKAGDVVQVEDTVGKGHRTRNIQAAVRKSLVITYGT